MSMECLHIKYSVYVNYNDIIVLMMYLGIIIFEYNYVG